MDMDAFFAAVEQRDNPAYRDKPVIVGSDPKEGAGRGVVSTCSYEARKYGIHSALPISIAYRKCPHGIFLPVDMQKYADESYKIFEILERFTPDIEPVGIDEAFMDITHSYHLFGTPVETCSMIKNTIKKELDLTASIGLAPNMMTAKIASDLKKPDGLVVVTKDTLLQFLSPLPVGKLWGIGEKTRKHLEKYGIHYVGDIAKHDVSMLVQLFGRNGEHIWELANGIDPRIVEAEDITKSIGNEHTFEKDTQDKDLMMDTLMYLSEKVSHRLRKNAFKGRTVTLRIRFSDFSTFTRSTTIPSPSNFVNDIYETCMKSLEKFDLKKNAVRLLGVRASNLIDAAGEQDLFNDDPKEMKNESLHRALDRIIDKFGEGAIAHRG